MEPYLSINGVLPSNEESAEDYCELKIDFTTEEGAETFTVKMVQYLCCGPDQGIHRMIPHENDFDSIFMLACDVIRRGGPKMAGYIDNPTTEECYFQMEMLGASTGKPKMVRYAVPANWYDRPVHRRPDLEPILHRAKMAKSFEALSTPQGPVDEQ
jgi:hypothetical protein